jgi:hypothetical protein
MPFLLEGMLMLRDEEVVGVKGGRLREARSSA